MMIKRLPYFLLAFLAVAIGLYPGIYFVIDRKFGLLATKEEALLGNIFWNTGFYTHILFGGLALLIGWTQFNSRLRARNITLHRKIGKVYVVSVLLSGLAGVYIGFFATGGIVASLGFICLGITWLYTTLLAYRFIRNRNTEFHRRMMVYSYAACFAAVTLRLWLPMLTALFHDFTTAYRIVAWLCWLPNLAVARYIVIK